MTKSDDNSWLRKIFPRALWSRRFTIIWAGCFATVLAFDLLWSMATSFRGLGFASTYIFGATLALAMAAPAAIWRSRWPSAIILVAADLLAIANLMYCRTYFTAIPLDSYGLASNLNRYTSTLWDSLRLADVGFLVILIFTVLLAYRLPKPSSWKPTLRFLASIPLMAVIVSIGILCRGGFYNEYDRLTQSCRFYTCGVPTYTIAGHLIYNAMCQDIYRVQHPIAHGAECCPHRPDNVKPDKGQEHTCSDYADTCVPYVPAEKIVGYSFHFERFV